MNLFSTYCTPVVLTVFLLFNHGLSAQSYTNPDILKVLVDPETNYVHIYYTGTDHPDVISYMISHWRITGGNPVASGVPIGSSNTLHTGAAQYHWTDYIMEVETQPVGFTAGAYNSGGEPINQSYPPDSTIHLSASYDSCLASVSLQWNDYNAWRGNILEYEVRGTNSSGSFNVLATVPASVRDTVITGLQANNQYLFYIVARKNSVNPGDTVTSNGVKFSTPHSYYPEYIHADYGTVGDGNHPAMHFAIDSLSELGKYILYRSEDPTGTYMKIDSFSTSSSVIEYTDEDVDASVRPYYYKLSAINFCQEEVVTSENIAGTICLNGSMPEQTNEDGIEVDLNWTDYHEWINGVAIYDIERRFSNEDFALLDETHQTTYTDPSLEGLRDQQMSSEVCYRITAHENPGSSHSPDQALSSSNTFCILLPMNIEFIDAFVPELSGFSTFGPTMDFIPVFFDFKIFNRSGTKVFESKDPQNPRWDGKYENGEIAAEGVYRYQLEYGDESGNRSVINGRVTVVRQ